jgi:hypothetical protein
VGMARTDQPKVGVQVETGVTGDNAAGSPSQGLVSSEVSPSQGPMGVTLHAHQAPQPSPGLQITAGRASAPQCQQPELPAAQYELPPGGHTAPQEDDVVLAPPTHDGVAPALAQAQGFRGANTGCSELPPGKPVMEGASSPPEPASAGAATMGTAGQDQPEAGTSQDPAVQAAAAQADTADAVRGSQDETRDQPTRVTSIVTIHPLRIPPVLVCSAPVHQVDSSEVASQGLGSCSSSDMDAEDLDEVHQAHQVGAQEPLVQEPSQQVPPAASGEDTLVDEESDATPAAGRDCKPHKLPAPGRAGAKRTSKAKVRC